MNTTRAQLGGSQPAGRSPSYVNIAAGSRPRAGAHGAVAAMARTRPGQVLIVDDDPGIRGFVSMALRADGYQTITAVNGQEGLERALEARPDLILLDLSMPVMNGWEMQRRLNEHGLAIPIVFMTAGYSARAEAEQHGAAGYLAKPFEVEDLIDVVGRFAGVGRPV